MGYLLLSSITLSLSLVQAKAEQANKILGIGYDPSISQNFISSINPTTGVTTRLNSFSFDSGYWNPPVVVAGNRAYARSSADTLYQFDAETGQILTTVALTGDPLQSFAASVVNPCASASQSENGIGCGNGATASGSYATAYGPNSVASGNNSVALGYGATASIANSVALGSNSITGLPNTGEYTINGGSIAGNNSTGGTISIGAPGAERQIQNVAAGVVSATSTNAVNGSQLYAVGSQVNTLSNNINSLGQNTMSGFQNAYGQINNNQKEARQGIAMAAAIAQAPMPSAPGKTSWKLNNAIYKNAAATSLSIAHRLPTKVPVAVTAGVAIGLRNSAIVTGGLQGEF